jgi:hypothetical protein
MRSDALYSFNFETITPQTLIMLLNKLFAFHGIRTVQKDTLVSEVLGVWTCTTWLDILTCLRSGLSRG